MLAGRGGLPYPRQLDAFDNLATGRARRKGAQAAGRRESGAVSSLLGRWWGAVASMMGMWVLIMDETADEKSSVGTTRQ